jgi:hypothetical protein
MWVMLGYIRALCIMLLFPADISVENTKQFCSAENGKAPV